MGWLLHDEGSAYSACADDHGGPTRYGITQATLSAWRRAPVAPDAVAALTEPEAAAIYAARYWRPLKGDALPSDTCGIVLLDLAALCGTRTAVRLAQQACGMAAAKQDGIVGPQTLAALVAAREDVWLTRIVTASIQRFFQICERDSTQHKFLRNWSMRALRLLALLAAPP